jgi:hypothetical protein
MDVGGLNVDGSAFRNRGNANIKRVSSFQFNAPVPSLESSELVSISSMQRTCFLNTVFIKIVK